MGESQEGGNEEVERMKPPSGRQLRELRDNFENIFRS